MTRGALELVVQSIFDYSGTFPPESKSFEDALKTSAQFPKTLQRPWLLNSDFVTTFDELLKITPDLLANSGFTAGRSFSVSVLGSSYAGDTAKLQEEIQYIQNFNREGLAQPIQRAAVSYEVKLSGKYLEQFLSIASSLENSDTILAVEPDLSTPNWEHELSDFLGVLDGYEAVSLKIRGTGPTAIGNEKIARVIARTAVNDRHLKATGGMHHPILEDRYKNDLGFLNIASSILLRREYGDEFTESEILSCLKTNDPFDFKFDTSLHWKQWTLTSLQIRDLKQRARFSIGSCSIHEPDRDLSRLFGTPK